MKTKSNPIPSKGQRNHLCPYYKGCLDHAAGLNWPTWHCDRCPYQSSREEDGITVHYETSGDPSWVDDQWIMQYLLQREN